MIKLQFPWNMLLRAYAWLVAIAALGDDGAPGNYCRHWVWPSSIRRLPFCRLSRDESNLAWDEYSRARWKLRPKRDRLPVTRFSITLKKRYVHNVIFLNNQIDSITGESSSNECESLETNCKTRNCTKLKCKWKKR